MFGSTEKVVAEERIHKDVNETRKRIFESRKRIFEPRERISENDSGYCLLCDINQPTVETCCLLWQVVNGIADGGSKNQADLSKNDSVLKLYNDLQMQIAIDRCPLWAV